MKFLPQNISLKEVKLTVIFTVLAMALFMAVPAFAQVPTLAIGDSDTIQSNLFTGANVILVGLFGVMILIAGISLGKGIMTAIVNAVKSAF